MVQLRFQEVAQAASAETLSRSQRFRKLRRTAPQEGWGYPRDVLAGRSSTAAAHARRGVLAVTTFAAGSETA